MTAAELAAGRLAEQRHQVQDFTAPAMSPADLAAHIAASHLSPRGIAYLARCEKALNRKVVA